MSICCDIHLHTSFSSDSETPMEEMTRRCLQLGLTAVCFTEHMDLDYPGGAFQADLPAYHREFCRLRELFADRIELLFGLEMGMQPHLSGAFREMARRWPFDFLIASQHLVEGADPYEKTFWADQSAERALKAYFQELLADLEQMEDFDTCAHLDYIVRYLPEPAAYSPETALPLIDPILRLLIQREKCLEVNTAGLRKTGAANPSPLILQRYYDLGGRLITIGSDAHQPEHIAWAFPEVYLLLRRIGFTHYALFRSRKRFLLPL